MFDCGNVPAGLPSGQSLMTGLQTIYYYKRNKIQLYSDGENQRKIA